MCRANPEPDFQYRYRHELERAQQLYLHYAEPEHRFGNYRSFGQLFGLYGRQRLYFGYSYHCRNGESRTGHPGTYGQQPGMRGAADHFYVHSYQRQ